MGHQRRLIFLAGATAACFVVAGACSERSGEGESEAVGVPPQEDAQSSESMPVDPEQAVNPVPALGAGLYAERCASCHGPSGLGDGPMTAYLAKKPRDFAAGEWQYVPDTSTDEAIIAGLVEVIHNGIPDAGMKAMGGVLSADEIKAIALHVLGLSGAAP